MVSYVSFEKGFSKLSGLCIWWLLIPWNLSTCPSVQWWQIRPDRTCFLSVPQLACTHPFCTLELVIGGALTGHPGDNTEYQSCQSTYPWTLGWLPNSSKKRPDLQCWFLQKIQHLMPVPSAEESWILAQCNFHSCRQQATSCFHAKTWSLSEEYTSSVFEGQEMRTWLALIVLSEAEDLLLEFWVKAIPPCFPFFFDFSLCNNGKYIYCCSRIIRRTQERVFSSSYLSNHRHSTREKRWC